MNASIAAKLVEVMKAVDAVEKRGKNVQQSYAYVKATDVANEVRKALNAAGVAFNYSVLSERFWESQTKSGTTQFFCSLTVSVMFTDMVSGESVTVQGIGWGADSQEKAPYKAMTGALKYALRMNFLIPDESDPEEAEAQESVRIQQATQRSTQALAKGPKLITKVKADLLRSLYADQHWDKERTAAILKTFGFGSFGEITDERFQDVKDILEGQ